MKDLPIVSTVSTEEVEMCTNMKRWSNVLTAFKRKYSTL